MSSRRTCAALSVTACIIAAPIAPHAKTLENTSWLQPQNLSQAIYLEIEGKRMDLNRDLAAIVSYYKNKDTIPYLLTNAQDGLDKRACSRDLRKNAYTLRPTDKPVVLPQDLSWSEDPFNDKNWVFFFHTLSFSECLAEGYRTTADLWYMERLKWIIQDWWADNFTPDPPSPTHSWHDHAVAKRLENVTTVWEFVRRFGALDADFVDTVIRFVYWHARILDEDEQLKSHGHNHAVDQAYSLFRAGAVFPEFEMADVWRENALPRLRRELENMFTAEGVQAENSPGYHQSHGMPAFAKLEYVREYTGESLSPRLEAMDDYALRFATIITRPDGFLPELGDTEPNTRLFAALPNLEMLPWYPHYQYVVSSGVEGEPPDETRFIFPQSGYYVYRDQWDPPGRNAATQLILKSASWRRGIVTMTMAIYCCTAWERRG